MSRHGAFLFGLVALLAYWYSIRPGSSLMPGHVEDICYLDMNRSLLADQLREFGKPHFWTRRFMTPEGASVPYMAWSLEFDWIGAYAWLWNPEFPFVWAWSLVSFLASFLGVGFILGKMGFSPGARWGLALVPVLFNIPRHFKAWHHAEHLYQHWFYWSIFLDAWIWQRFVRERRWSLKLEAWRGVCLVGMLGTAGYYWGPLILEWTLVRGAMLWLARVDRKQADRVRIEWEARHWVLPLSLIALLLVIVLRWYLPLFAEARKLGVVEQGISWFVRMPLALFPLWPDAVAWFFSLLRGQVFQGPPSFARWETVVGVGWALVVPWGAALYFVRRKVGGAGFRIVAPFVVLAMMAYLYFGIYPLLGYHEALQAIVPFMSFFRVANRWGLMLPAIYVAAVVLAWPELTRGVRKAWAGLSTRARRRLATAGALMLALELAWLGYPTNYMPPLSDSMKALLRGVAEAPGDSVLALPFCVAGGNGVCAGQQCPSYPESTANGCFRIWHGKNVYGLYQSRMTPAHCAVYDKAPYQSWFSAWREQRCFTPAEWDGFCSYLGEHRELAAVLLMPDTWSAAGAPSCLAEFERRLGPPRATGSYSIVRSPGARNERTSRAMWFEPGCRN